ncbi:uncharacterized protein LOC125955621 [Anopheles darlingi]|uniref:uncharacterized protein LOC125955621 n=1 Tax=Anopheles darlingi TaxID=43151 RepID=UPI002100376B|nr:uncharacterized protein LOC125955621 [Anopheles darlingi]
MAMEPPDVILSPDRDPVTSSSNEVVQQQQHRTHPQSPPATIYQLASGGGTGGQRTAALLLQHQQSQSQQQSPQPVHQQLTSIAVPTALLAGGSAATTTGAGTPPLLPMPIPATSAGLLQLQQPPSAPIERLSRPMAFDKMESLVREMQDPETGVPVRSQKLFLTSIPSAFMGYDLVEWLMERLSIEESEALNISNQLCQHGYFFPVSDSKTLMVKDDSSLYRFQTPYYWPWQQKAPDQIEYAIYLAKRSLRNKQRHGLEDYETDALASLHKNLKGKWDFIMMQAEEQVRLAKERKKGDKIVGDSQERAYWRVHRPPPGQFTPLEPCPIPSRDRQGRPRKRTVEDWQREVDILKASLGRNRVKMSQACESLAAYYETFSEYDPMMQPPLPSNPWVTEDVAFWQLNHPVVEVPTEKRVKRWGISIEEVVSDPTGLQEFTHYLKKEYSHENIRFWMAVNDLRRSSHSQIPRKVKDIYEEFLEPGAPCEINIDGKTMERVQQGLKSPSRFAFDSAAEHIYMLLLKKDCYPRFVRSEHYKSLMANAIQPSHKKRFFGFGGGGAKKKGSTSTAPNPSLLTQPTHGGASSTGGTVNSLSKRRGSDRSLSGSAHELAISGVKDCTKVPHSHSQSNLSDIPYREVSKPLVTTLEVTLEAGGSQAAPQCAVCPWDTAGTAPDKAPETSVSVSVCPWDESDAKQPPAPATGAPAAGASTGKPRSDTSKGTTHTVMRATGAEISEVSERMKRSCGLRQNTLDGDFHSTKRLAPAVTEQRRASMTMAPRLSDLQFSMRANSTGGGGGVTPPDTGGSAPFQQHQQQHPPLTHQSSVQARVSQGSLSTSFEEKEPAPAPPAPASPILLAATPTRTEDCTRRQQSLDQDAGTAPGSVLPDQRTDGTTGVAVSLIATIPCSAAPATSNTTLAINATTTSATATTVTTTITTAASTTTTTTSSAATMNTTATDTAASSASRTVTQDTGPESPITGTPRISVIYAVASLDEDAPPLTPHRLTDNENDELGGEEKEKARGEVARPAASVATQTLESASMSPLHEEEHFFPEVLLVHHHHHPHHQHHHHHHEHHHHEHEHEHEQEQCPHRAPSGVVPSGISGATTDYHELLLDGVVGDVGGTGLVPGCVAPAPTPAPSIAPLAEVELDPPDDDDDEDDDENHDEAVQEQELVTVTKEEDKEEQEEAENKKKQKKDATDDVVIVEDATRRRKRRERHPERPDTDACLRAQRSEEESGTERKGGNAVCPWDDEDESAVDETPYVKTYSTLGYL